MRRRTGTTLVGGALTILGACAPPDTVTRLEHPTTVSAVTTSVREPTMVTTATTPPAPDSSLPGVDVTAGLRADTTATWEASHHCLAAPEQCDTAAVAVAASPAAEALRRRLDDLTRERLRAVPDSGPLRLVIESAEVAGDGSGVVVACVTDGVVLVDVADPADPLDDIVFDDSLGSYRWRWVMQHTEAGWRRQTVDQLGYYPGVEQCPA